MIETIQFLGFLVAFVSLILTLIVGFFKIIMPMSKTIVRIDTNLTNGLQKEREDIERIEKKVDCLTDRVVDQEARLDELERKVL